MYDFTLSFVFYHQWKITAFFLVMFFAFISFLLILLSLSLPSFKLNLFNSLSLDLTNHIVLSVPHVTNLYLIIRHFNPFFFFLPFYCLSIHSIYLNIELFFFNFYWSIVDLQCCVSFKCTTKWISYKYIYIYSHFKKKIFSHIGHYRVWSGVPCAIQHVLINYLFYI